MQDRFLEWSKKKYSTTQRYAALIPLGIVFALIIPFLIVRMSNMDNRLDIPRLVVEPLNAILAVILIVIGLIFAYWSIHAEFSLGEGTPTPLMPTQKLVTRGPFRYCRNPMAFGTICAYSGIAVLIGSLSSLLLVSLLTAALLIYNRYFEERELEARFGQDYREYKKRVPFIIPGNLWSRATKVGRWRR